MLTVLMLSLVALSGLNVTLADVVYSQDNVTVVFHYSLDPFQKINAFLFGCDDVGNVVLSLLSNSTDFKIVKVDSTHAVLEFNIINEGDYYYFQGVNLTTPLPIRININNSIMFQINDSTRIPEMYVFK
ncbi:hypothetical protein DRP05_00105 [Archaeoglobales archaeon]|nr:MAG: hypothetical protein DRP05_00105 [Archaeoglobales archaeon]